MIDLQLTKNETFTLLNALKTQRFKLQENLRDDRGFPALIKHDEEMLKYNSGILKQLEKK